MITAHFYKQITEQRLNDALKDKVNRLVEIRCLRVLKTIEKHIVLKGKYGTAAYHIDSIVRIIGAEGYEIKR